MPKAQCLCSPLLSQARNELAAVARLGETCARGFLDLPFSVGGRKGSVARLSPPTSIFDKQQGRSSPPTMEATLTCAQGSPREELVFGVSFWGCWVVKGKFLPLRGCLVFRRPRPTRRFFVENRMAKKDQKRVNSIIAA